MFDSGVGGLSILREIHCQLPGEPTIYFADQAHVPYGSRSLDEVRDLSEGITRFLLERTCKLIVVACNTASAAALHHLRDVFPHTPFVGMEPAVKPAAELTLSRKVAVLATPATFQGELFASVVERFAEDIEVFQVVLPNLVEEIENGLANDERARQVIEEQLAPAQRRQVDTLVLACTHYAFVIPILERAMGPSVQVIDPAPAIARQVSRMLESYALAATVGSPSERRYLTSGDPAAFQLSLIRLLGSEGEIEAARWRGSALYSS